ncbi:MAG: rod shape-determining protein [Bacteroidales bacterium]|nr:rod shape-determining protein [Bacteroidales bacterium]
MEQQKYIVAIEIGSSKIKGAIGAFDTAKNILSVLAVEEESLTGDELGDSVRYGVIQNVDKVSNALNRIRRKLENSPAVAPRKIRGVYAAVGGRSMVSTPCEVTRQFTDDTEVTEMVFDQLRREARQTPLPEREIVDVTTRECLINNMNYIHPVGVIARNIKATFNLVSAKTPLRRNLARVISDRIGLDINGYIVRPLAEANLVLTDEEKRLGTMMVDFGAETISVVIYKNGAVQYLSTLPIGSRNITRDLMTLNYTEERADDIKKLAGNADYQDPSRRGPRTPDGLDYTEINNHVAARSGEIIANIQAQLEYADLKATDIPCGIVIVGGGAKLKGFCSLLGTQTNVKVRIGSPSGLIRIEDARIQPNDAVDVISILAEAAKGMTVECMDRPMTTNTPEDTSAATSDDDNLGDEGSRIGEDSPAYLRKKEKERREREKREEKERKRAEKEERERAKREAKEKEKAEEDYFAEEEDEEDKIPVSSFWGGIKNRINKLKDKVANPEDVDDDNF